MLKSDIESVYLSEAEKELGDWAELNEESFPTDMNVSELVNTVFNWDEIGQSRTFRKIESITQNRLFSFDDVRHDLACLLYTSPSPRDATLSRMPSSA